MNGEQQRPDVLGAARGLLTFGEWLHLVIVRRSLARGRLANWVTWIQHHLMVFVLRSTTKNVHHLHHLERVPEAAKTESLIIVCNHRSFFDFYVVAPELLYRGFRQRVMFPVRSNFFYGNLLGLLINGLLSGFAMYPPIFRDRKRSHLNVLGLEDIIWLLRAGGHLVGFHPEGTRNAGDPYELLPARPGIGHLVRHANTRVIPVFTNGIPVKDALLQLKNNFTRSGTPIHTVFGAPIDFGSLLTEEPTPALYKKIANVTRDALVALGEEERSIRAAFSPAEEASTQPSA